MVFVIVVSVGVLSIYMCLDRQCQSKVGRKRLRMYRFCSFPSWGVFIFTDKGKHYFFVVVVFLSSFFVDVVFLSSIFAEEVMVEAEAFVDNEGVVVLALIVLVASVVFGGPLA